MTPLPRGKAARCPRLTVASPQLQEAFARGALKPGLNVVLEERPKRRNDVVSGAFRDRAGTRVPQRRVRGRGAPAGAGVPGQDGSAGLLHRPGGLGITAVAPRGGGSVGRCAGLCRAALLPQAGLRHCLAEFKQQLAWVERLDVTSGQVADPTSQSASDKDAVDAENDFQREMSL